MTADEGNKFSYIYSKKFCVKVQLKFKLEFFLYNFYTEVLLSCRNIYLFIKIQQEFGEYVDKV